MLVLVDHAVEDAADADAADVFIVVDVRDLQLQRFFEVGDGAFDLVDDGFHQRTHVHVFVVGVEAGVAVAAGGVDDGEIEGVVVGVELHEEVEDLVEDFGGAGIGAVDLVDHHDGLEVVLQGFFENEAGLGHGAFKGVDQQQDAVGHFEDAFDFAAEVGVAGGVDDVDLADDAFGVAVGHGDIFGEDGDAAFAFERVVVEDEFAGDRCAAAEHAGLAEHGVDERGFAVIDVGDDGDIAEFVTAFLGGHKGTHEGVGSIERGSIRAGKASPVFYRKLGVKACAALLHCAALDENAG